MAGDAPHKDPTDTVDNGNPEGIHAGTVDNDTSEGDHADDDPHDKPVADAVEAYWGLDRDNGNGALVGNRRKLSEMETRVRDQRTTWTVATPMWNMRTTQ